MDKIIINVRKVRWIVLFETGSLLVIVMFVRQVVGE